MKSLLKSGALAVIAMIGAQASTLQAMPLQSVITGADMAGIEVEAFFGGFSQTVIWAATSTDASVPEGEGFAGAAIGKGWSLAQQGFTLGNESVTGALLGLWTFSNFTGSLVTGFEVRGLPGMIVFDNIGPVAPEGTPGSDVGRPFTAEPGAPALTATYSDAFSLPDLYGTLNVSFETGLASDSTLNFFADTDRLVPAPATLLLLLAGGIALVGRRRTSAS